MKPTKKAILEALKDNRIIPNSRDCMTETDAFIEKVREFQYMYRHYHFPQNELVNRIHEFLAAPKICLRVGAAVYNAEFNTVGVIIDRGHDGVEMWFRTDADGVRIAKELELLPTKADILAKIEAGAIIAPSTRKLLNL